VHKTLDVSEFRFSDRETRILKSALNADKYTAIANNENISVSYVKKCMKYICQKMQVSDRTELLATYSGYSLINQTNEIAQ
jgi:DNA-binding NarL/FixJ family response regulator